LLSPKESRKVLVKVFRKKYIVNLDEIFHVLDTHSRMSVFRRLKPMGYLTSFTHAGRYYTLPDIPKFDKLGLWFYQYVGFSSAGTLKSTIVDIVHSSEVGMTPKEMLNLLRLRVPNSLHNTLHELIKNKQLERHRLQGLPLYTSIDSDIAQNQMATRREKIKSRSLIRLFPPSRTPSPSLWKPLELEKSWLFHPQCRRALPRKEWLSPSIRWNKFFLNMTSRQKKKWWTNLEDA